MKSQALSNAQRAIQDQEARVWCLVGGHIIVLRQLSIYNFVVRMIAFGFFQLYPHIIYYLVLVSKTVQFYLFIRICNVGLFCFHNSVISLNVYVVMGFFSCRQEILMLISNRNLVKRFQCHKHFVSLLLLFFPSMLCFFVHVYNFVNYF